VDFDCKEAGIENPSTGEQQTTASKTEGSVPTPLNSVTNLITLDLKGCQGKFEFRIMRKRTRAVIPDIKFVGNNKLRYFTFSPKSG
jgi:hypothetical protein